MMKEMSVCAFLFFSMQLAAQNNVSIKYFGLSIHPKGEQENAFLMPNKIDKNGYFVLNFGGVVSYEHFIFSDKFSLKVAQALYADCAVRTGGFSHIGIRGRIFAKGKHSINGGIGPTFIFRRNWLDLQGYKNQNRFKGDHADRWQYLFIAYGGEFEYKYYWNEACGLSVSFVPGYPDLMNLSAGISYKFKKKRPSG